MRWTPLSVSTMLLSSPTLRPKAASSNGFCIWPRWKKPRSPPARAEEQSLLAKHPEKSKVSVVRAPMLRGERHLRVHTGERGKVVLGGILLELLLKLLELFNRILPRARDVGLRTMPIATVVSSTHCALLSGTATHLFPRAGSSGTSMLDEQMAGAHLVGLLGCARSIGRVEVLCAWKRSDRLVRMALWNLPCGLLRHRVVEVRQSTRVAEANLPLRLSYTVLSVYTRDSSWI